MNKVNEKIEDLKSGWYIWLFPFIAILISGYLFVEYLNQRGTEITIRFEDGSSLEAGKTQIRYRGVPIGSVKDVTLSEDGEEVLAHAVLKKDAEPFAVEGTRFWIVKPKIGFQGISGLETLIEGTYISVQPGKRSGPKALDYKGQIGGESSDPLEDTVAYYLETDQVGSVSAGDLVTFRGMSIGSVTKVTLGKTSQMIIVQINIQNRYVKVVRTNTVFWRKVAVDATLGLFKSSLKINSLDTLMNGGIDLFTPDKPGPIAKAQSLFALSTAPPKGYEKWNPKLEFP